MAALFYRVLHALLQRKLFPYPTLDKLRTRRQEAARADEIGQQIQTRLIASSSSSFMEAWRLFRVFKRPKAKVKKVDIKRKPKDKAASESTLEVTETIEIREGSGDDVEEADVLVEPSDEQAETDGKMALLNALNDVADLHERAKKLVKDDGLAYCLAESVSIAFSFGESLRHRRLTFWWVDFALSLLTFPHSLFRFFASRYSSQ